MISINRIKYARAKYATVAFLCFFLYVNNLSASHNFFSPTDTLKLKKDSGSILSFKNTQVAYSSFINPRNNMGQELPEFVQRLELYPVISIAGIKLSSSFFLSTEDFNEGRNINRINISFDRNSFTNFKRKVTTEDNIGKKIDSLNNAIEDQKRLLNGLNEKMENKEYLEQIENAKAIKLRAAIDSNYYKNNRERVNYANGQVLDYDKNLNARNGFSGKIDSLYQLRKTYDFIYNLNKESDKDYALNQSGKVEEIRHKRSFFNTLTSPSRLEIFDVSPNWSPLFFSGINLRGGIIEYNTSNVIAGFTAGFVNSFNWYESVFNRDNFIYSGRLGYGNLEKNNIIFTYLKGTNNSQSNLNPIKENDLLGIQLNIHITENHLLFIEKAWSNQSNGDYTQGFNEVVQSSSKSFSNGAFNMKYNGNITKTKTRIEAKVKLNELYFYSMGAPANRKDVFKSQLNVKQVVFKNRLDAQVIASLDKDNISETKYASSTIQSLQMILNLKLRKSAFKLDLQRIITTSSFFQGNIAEVNIANLSMVKPYRLFRKQITTIALFNYVNTRTLFNDTSFNNYLLSVNNIITINNKLRVNLSYTGAYKKAETAGNITNNAEVSSTYTVNNYSITIKYAYLNISDMETRNTIGLNGSVNFTTALSGSLLCTYDNIYNKYLTQNNFISLQTRLIYTF